MPIELFVVLSCLFCFISFMVWAHSNSGSVSAVIYASIFAVLIGFAIISYNTMQPYVDKEVKIVIAHDRATFLLDGKIHNANQIFLKQLKDGQIVQISKYKPSLGLHLHAIVYSLKDETCEKE